MKLEHSAPAGIERASMQIIAAELAQKGIEIPPENRAVVLRAIHASADFDYADNLAFTPGAVQAGVAALQRGAAIVTDTNMALAGLSKPSLAKLGAQAVCYMADAAVAAEADRRATTRAAVSMERAMQEHPGAVVAVGNAPTALVRLTELMQQGARPALVVAVPVGFVNVVESKQQIFAACQALGVPCIAAMGRKGGSSVAAAIGNALLYTAADTLDPTRRGWK